MLSKIMMALLVAGATAIKIQSDPICNSAGCTQYLHPSEEGWKKNYFVPNFGKDHDIEETQKSIASAEKAVAKKMKLPTIY